MAVHTNDVVLLLSSSFHFKFCENLSVEDNFNKTFFDKTLPHTTAVVTEFEAKIQVFSGIANGRGNLGLHLLTYVFFICNIQCLFALRFAPNCVVSSFAPFTGSLLIDLLFTSNVVRSFNLLESLFINAFLGQVYLSTEQLPMKAKFQSVHILTFHHL